MSVLEAEAGNVLSENARRRSEEMERDNNKRRIFAVLAALVIVLTPVLHFRVVGWLLWSQKELQVDRANCKCACWDTIFKGQYEKGVASYKHVYFNITGNSLKIWILTVGYLLAFYECAKKIFYLFSQNRIRPTMMFLFALGVFPHYYSWWNYFNYLNDDFYTQWYHQIYFTVTELLSSFFIVKLLDRKVVPLPRDLLIILSVAVFHVSASFYDQFLTNVLIGHGKYFQVLRDIALMIPDLLNVWLPWRELGKLNKPLRTLFTRNELTAALVFFVFSWTGVLMF